MNDYKLKYCLWSKLKENPFSFNCQLLNTELYNLVESVNYCNKCKYFQDTNIELENINYGKTL